MSERTLEETLEERRIGGRMVLDRERLFRVVDARDGTNHRGGSYQEYTDRIAEMTSLLTALRDVAEAAKKVRLAAFLEGTECMPGTAFMFEGNPPSMHALAAALDELLAEEAKDLP